ncbi:MAG: PAS domain S-box protein [Desulfomonile tiedjei]|nr:PAS domain S-box protein [Desulfomonile tiedjei]
MKGMKKSSDELVTELEEMRARVAQLERAESELRRVAETLQQSEMKFRKITEKSIVGVYLIQDELFRYVNPHMAEIFGFEVEDLINKRGPKDVVFSEDWPLVEGHLKARLAGKMEAINYQFRGVTSSGEVVHQEVYGSRMDYNGRPAVIGTLVDITRRVGLERNLEIQLKKFQALYHLAVAMTAERSVEKSLALVVEKSRQLLGADVGFIALRRDDRAGLPFRTVSGARTQDFKGLKLPPATECEGNAIQTGQGEFLNGYFHKLEQAFPDQIHAEGLVSGLAVSVNIGVTNLGILCICDRSETLYTESQMETLSLMGNLAALEITRRQAEGALAHSEKQLRSLSSQLLTAQEQERKRVAQELHDGIGQSLTALKFEVENAIRKMSDNSTPIDWGPLQTIVPHIQDVIEEVGRIAMDLRPSILDDLGVLATVGWLCRDFQRTCLDIRVEKLVDLAEDDVQEHQKIVIFRVLQEALNNVAKHSRARLVRVGLHKKNGRIELSIQDDGVGFNCHAKSTDATSRRGFGLASMKERTRLSGGSLSVKAKKGAGTTVRAIWPAAAEGSATE